MFDSKINIYEKFFSIRDQDVYFSKANQQKSPQQIKREHMQTTIPMFSKSMNRYKWVKKPSPIQTFNDLLQSTDSLIQSRKNRLACNDSMDIYTHGPVYQAHFDPRGEETPPENCASHAMPRMKNVYTANERPEVPEQAAAVHKMSLGHRRLTHFLGRSKLAASKSISGLDHPKTGASKKLLLSTSAGNLRYQATENRSPLAATTFQSPKWSQVLQKNLKYPHIC